MRLESDPCLRFHSACLTSSLGLRHVSPHGLDFSKGLMQVEHKNV